MLKGLRGHVRVQQPASTGKPSLHIYKINKLLRLRLTLKVRVDHSFSTILDGVLCCEGARQYKDGSK